MFLLPNGGRGQCTIFFVSIHSFNDRGKIKLHSHFSNICCVIMAAQSVETSYHQNVISEIKAFFLLLSRVEPIIFIYVYLVTAINDLFLEMLSNLKEYHLLDYIFMYQVTVRLTLAVQFTLLSGKQ